MVVLAGYRRTLSDNMAFPRGQGMTEEKKESKENSVGIVQTQYFTFDDLNT